MSIGQRFAVGYVSVVLVAGAVAMVTYAMSIGHTVRWPWAAGAPVPLLLGLWFASAAHRGYWKATGDRDRDWVRGRSETEVRGREQVRSPMPEERRP